MDRFQRAGLAGAALLLAGFLTTGVSAKPIPFLQRQGTAVRLIVGGEPFLILGGELGNSSASSLDSMEPVWPKLAQLNLNTVLAPVYWELIEPQEGQFDFTRVDGLIRQAQRYDLRLVLLWFGSWKNGMSCYVPSWVKTDSQRFPKAKLQSGRPMEMLTAFSKANLEADKSAFTALMRHLKKTDKQRTVIMVQVENEIAMIEEARDWSGGANEAFGRPVPERLVNYLKRQQDVLAPELRQARQEAGCKTSGNWEDVFGQGLHTDEIFMAWHYARYVEQIAAAGKAEYPLPMFVNAALIRPGLKPGQNPSAGPLPHVWDVWRAAAPSIDFFSPDIYFPNFADWCGRYHTADNPLFVPEAARGPNMAVHAFYAIGAHEAIGFSPFSIDNEPASSSLAEAYRICRQLSPLILEKQGLGQTAGFLLDQEQPMTEITLGSYTLKVSHDYTWGWSNAPKDGSDWPRAGGLVIRTGEHDYFFAGSGFIVTFNPAETNPSRQAGILTIEEGQFIKGRWVPGRILNGDESHQGRHLRIPMESFGIQRITLYTYE